MKKATITEVAEAGLSVMSTANDIDAVKEDLVVTMAACGYNFTTDDATELDALTAVLDNAVESYKKHKAITFAVLPGSEIDIKHGCKEWDYTNNQPVSVVKTTKMSKEEIEAMTNKGKKPNNKKEDITMSKSKDVAKKETREERRVNWTRVPGNGEEKKADVVTDTKVQDAKEKLDAAASKYNVPTTKTIETKKETTKGYKKLSNKFTSNNKSFSSRDNFWYRKVEGIDLSKGTINEDGSVVFEEAQQSVSRILVWDRKEADTERIICHLWIELENGIMLKGFKVWNSEAGDGSIYMTEPQFSYIKKDEKEKDTKGNPKKTWIGHIDTDKAREFTALILNCVECMLDDSDADISDDDEE